MKIYQTEKFSKEIKDFPEETREDIFALVDRFLSGERLAPKYFKTFKIKEKIKIQEFKVKDQMGNWRAISTIYENDKLVFVYAFHKKSQALLEKDRNIITKRVKEVDL